MSWKARRGAIPRLLPLADRAGEVRLFWPGALEGDGEGLGGRSGTLALPGVLDVAITPDAHIGYGVPVGCVMATTGTLAMGPVGYDIGCGIAARGRTSPGTPPHQIA
jgi:hypothetical protein